jgi:nucleoside-diphosphate-sugar epimerase
MILITGADGFVGGGFYRFLKEKGIEACGTSLLPQEGLIQADITKPLKVLPKRIDVVVHLAARLSSSAEEHAQPEVAMRECLRVNAEGTLNLLKATKDAKHFIYVSTGAVYGQNPKPSETDMPRPDSWYSLSKHIGELYAERMCKSLTILRPGSVYGPGQQRFFIANLIKSLQSNHDVTIFGEGRTQLDLVYVKDLYDVLLKIISEKQCGTFNIGSGELVSVKEIATIAKGVFKESKSRIVFDSTKPESTNGVLLDTKKARKVLNLNMRYNVLDGFKDIRRG